MLSSDSSGHHAPNRSLHLALIPLGIGINIAIGTIVLLLKLPIYLDAIGTLIVTMLAGLRAGLLTAVLTQILAGYLVNPVLPYFIPTSAAIAIYIHIVNRKGAFRTFWGTLLAGIGLGVVAGVISAPIIVYVFGGIVATGRSLFTAYLLSTGERIMNAVVYSGMAAEPIDKTLQCFLTVWLLRGVPQSLIDHFQGRTATVAGYGGEPFLASSDARDVQPSATVLHPLARGLATVFGIVGTMLADDLMALLFIWAVVLLPFSAVAGTLKKHAGVLASVIVPLGLMLSGVWGWLVGAPPGMGAGTDPVGGLRYAGLIALQLTVFAGIFQLCFLTIPQSQLLSTFWHWGVRRDNLIVAIGAFTIWPELKMRAEQILTARYARGLMPDRRFFTRLRQVPYLLRPLLTWSLRAAIQRSEFWGQRRLLDRVAQIRHTGKSALSLNIAVVAAGLLWLGYNIVM